jgi:hypothetical protein
MLTLKLFEVKGSSILPEYLVSYLDKRTQSVQEFHVKPVLSSTMFYHRRHQAIAPPCAIKRAKQHENLSARNIFHTTTTMSDLKESEFENKVEDKPCEDENGDECDDDCQYIFPQRLMSILADERNSDAICWLPHGRAFIVRNRKVFAEKVMPRFFPRKSKYSSFTRKLNRW